MLRRNIQCHILNCHRVGSETMDIDRMNVHSDSFTIEISFLCLYRSDMNAFQQDQSTRARY